MTDRELLEAAAKAAGVALYWSDDDPECDWVQGTYPRIPDYKVLEKWTWKVWNPLADDGDALRLAHTVPMIVTPGTARLLDGRLFGADNNDIAATRRAIVRAAAEVGRKL